MSKITRNVRHMLCIIHTEKLCFCCGFFRFNTGDVFYLCRQHFTYCNNLSGFCQDQLPHGMHFCLASPLHSTPLHSTPNFALLPSTKMIHWLSTNISCKYPYLVLKKSVRGQGQKVNRAMEIRSGGKSDKTMNTQTTRRKG